jgi:hypothetical protein
MKRRAKTWAELPVEWRGWLLERLSQSALNAELDAEFNIATTHRAAIAELRKAARGGKR